MVEPKFFSFMTRTDYTYYQYVHVLVFHEKFTETKVREDFNESTHFNKLFNMK